jgi:hypothetical protein
MAHCVPPVDPDTLICNAALPWRAQRASPVKTWLLRVACAMQHPWVETSGTRLADCMHPMAIGLPDRCPLDGRLVCQVVASSQLALRGLAVGRRDEQLIGPEVIFPSAAHGNLQGTEQGGVEGLARREIANHQLEVINWSRRLACWGKAGMGGWIREGMSPVAGTDRSPTIDGLACACCTRRNTGCQERWERLTSLRSKRRGGANAA